jgi:hypothetical protein
MKMTSACSAPLRVSFMRAEKSNAEKWRKLEDTCLQEVANYEVRITRGEGCYGESK